MPSPKTMAQLPNKRFFYINSGSQLNEQTSTFSSTIQLPDYQDFDRVTLMQANIPISYYVIQTGFNIITLIENSSQTTITFQVGNYNANSFATILTSLLNIASPHGLTYTVSLPNTFTQVSTGKFTYTVNSSSYTTQFSFPVGSSINQQFGFNPGSTQTFTPGSGTSTLVSTNVVNFVPENTVFIHSNLVQDEYTDVLQEIYSSNSVPFQNLVFLNPDPLGYSKRLSSSRVQSVSFSLTDEFNNPLFLNGLDVVLTIMVYKDPTFYRKSEAFMKYQMTKEVNSLGEVESEPFQMQIEKPEANL